ncbi:methyltransferase domain-containing protein [Actinokineospora fastidiosa]|nr:methyltransferase domain-containing protein [Actinokineospora fastidiosa]
MTQPPSFRAEKTDDAQLARLVEVLDRQAATPGVTRLRAWAQDALAVRPGERALDIGSGTGSEVAALRAAGADAVGVEPNAGMRAVAAARHGDHFVDGDALALPFADASFDVVRCERVFQHLADPAGAAREIARVLRPGGRTAVLDSDWATAITHPGDPEVVAAFMGTMLGFSANPYAARRLPGQLTAAGLRVTDIGSQALIQPGIDTELLAMALGAAIAQGAITEPQRDRFLEDLRAGEAAGDFHMSVTMFAVIAVRD